jgi:hypothetical protein
MNLLYIIYTHNRPNILQECLSSLFEKNDVRPSRVLIIDDGSDASLKNSLYNFSLENSIKIPFDFLSFSPNIGYGTVAEFGIRMADIYSPDYVFFIESDYIFRKNGLDEVIEIFENTDYGKNAIGFSGYDNPDFYSTEKTNITFPKIILEDCGEDNLNREIMYKPFEVCLNNNKKINLEFVTNSCGTMYFNWKNWKKIKEQFPKEIEWWVKHTTDYHKQKRNLNDGCMSHGISWLWTKWAKKNGVDITKYAALLNIKPSIANHINGAGINGYIVGEGESFVGSPTFVI